MTSTSTANSPPSHRGGRTALAVLLVAGLAVSLAFAGWRLFSLVHAVRRLHGAPAVRDAGRIQPWMPLQTVAHVHRVPEPMLEDVLRQAGFDLQPRDLRPELPGGVQRHVGPLVGGSGQGDTGGPMLPVRRQSLRQIAAASGRDESQAVAVTADAIRQFRAEHPQPPPAPVAVQPRPLGNNG